MKTLIIGHVDHGKSTLTTAIMKVLQDEGIHIVESSDQDVPRNDYSHRFIEPEPMMITPQYIHPDHFTPPLTRQQRRKAEREAKKRK